MPQRGALVRRGWVAALSLLVVLYGALVILRLLYPVGYLPLILSASARESLDPALVCAVIRAESRFRPDAVSATGAIGLMQLMPETGAEIAAALGVAPYSPSALLTPEVNIRFGTWYLRQMLERFGDPEIALLAYNAGPSRTTDWIETGSVPFPETTAYVERVLRSMGVYHFYLGCPMLVQITPSLPL
jgi:soluble lytic murein transglycosylase